MSDDVPPLTQSPAQARSLAQCYQALAEQFEAAGMPTQAAREMQKAHWWLTYALLMAQVGSKDGGEDP